jgi:hypothetical protein
MARRRQEEEEEDESAVSVERVFEGRVVPGWREQLTVRAVAVSALLGAMFSVIVMKLNLTTGIIPSLNVSAGLLGFFFLTSWTKLLDKAGVANVRPFTRQENTVVQTCVVACSGIAFSGTHAGRILWSLVLQYVFLLPEYVRTLLIPSINYIGQADLEATCSG